MRPGEEEIVELVNAAVDGVATPEQQNELESLVETSPDVREMYEATRDLVRRLEAMNVEPPANLRAWLGQRPSVIALPRRAEARRSTFIYGWAAAAAIVLVFLVIGRHQLTDTGATMAPAWPVIQKIAAPEATLVARKDGDLVSLEVVVPRPAHVEIAWDPSQVTFVGVFDEKSASLRKRSVEFSLRDPSTRAGVIVRPRDGASSANVVVSVETREVLRGVVAMK
jgi:hypothetical protein